MYCDYREHLELLDDAERGRLMMALFNYAEHDIMPVLSGMTMMAFSFIRAQLDRDQQKYNDAVETNTSNGKKGGRPSKASGLKNNPNKPEQTERFISKPKQTEQTERFISKAKKPYNDNDNVNVNVNVNDDVNDYDNENENKTTTTCDEPTGEAELQSGGGGDNQKKIEQQDNPTGYAESCDIKKIVDFYEKNLTLMVSSVRTDVDYYLNSGVEASLIITCLKVAVDNDKRNWRYARAVLNRLLESGIKTQSAYDKEVKNSGINVHTKAPSGSNKPACKLDGITYL